jgi:hypothetical protein
MNTCRLHATLTQDSTLVLHGLPFKAGETVEVVIRQEPAIRSDAERCPLRGLPIDYDDPAEPVAQADWEAAQ